MLERTFGGNIYDFTGMTFPEVIRPHHLELVRFPWT